MHSIQTRFWEYLRDSKIGEPWNHAKRVVQGQHIPFSFDIGKNPLTCSRMIDKILAWLGEWKYHANVRIMSQGLVVVAAIISKKQKARVCTNAVLQQKGIQRGCSIPNTL
jgi:hypothetical protein